MRTMTDPGSPPPAGVIASALDLLFDPGQVIEVRALAETCTHSGYFTDTMALTRCAEALDTDRRCTGSMLPSMR